MSCLEEQLIFFLSVTDEDGSQKSGENQVKTKVSCSYFIESIRRVSIFIYLFLSLVLLLMSSSFHVFSLFMP